jgi:hypothetical protein
MGQDEANREIQKRRISPRPPPKKQVSLRNDFNIIRLDNLVMVRIF